MNENKYTLSEETKYFLSLDDWRTLLSRYDLEALNGKYCHLKFGFNAEKEIWEKFLDYFNKVEIGYNKKNGLYRLKLKSNEETFKRYHFKANDESFGEFLHNYLKGRNNFVEEDDSNMIKEYLNSVNYNDEYTDILGKATTCTCWDNKTSWDYDKAATAGVAAIAKTAATTSDSTLCAKPTTSDCIGYNTKVATFDYATVAEKADKVAVDTLSNRINLLENKIAEKLDKKENEKMGIDMKKMGFDFGPCGSAVKLSMYGLATKNAVGEWVSYNKDTKEIINVDILNFDAKGLIYKMPVAVKDVEIGDVIIHNGVVMFVEGINKDEETKKMQSVIAVDPKMGEVKEIILTKNMFGFNFITKVVNLFEMIAEKPSEDNPFGNMLPLMMFGEEHGDLAVMAMMMNSKGGKELMSNPMMFMALKDKKDLDPMMLMMLMNMNK